MKKTFICLLIIIASASCQKEPCENDSPIIGTWAIESIDSVIYIYPPEEFRVVKELKNSGSFVFSSNARGTLSCDLSGLTDFHNDFIWDYDSINKMIDFSFNNGTTIGLISEISDSLMTMYFRHYTGFPDWYSRAYYKIVMEKR